MNRKRMGGCLITIFAFLMLIIILFAAIQWRTNYAKTEILNSSSDDEHYSLIVYMIGEPDWPFGKTHCRFDLIKDDKKIMKYPFDIFNDGANAREGNFDITWNEDDVTIIVSGSEQNDAEYVLNYDGTTE